MLIFLVAGTFVTANIVLSFMHKQDIHQLMTDDHACPHCNLNQANLAGWDLNGFDLTQASMVGADLRCSNLKNSILAGANMKGSNLTGAQLDGADLLFANMDKVIWEDGTDCDEIVAKTP